jgi:hypothetical protein
MRFASSSEACRLSGNLDLIRFVFLKFTKLMTNRFVSREFSAIRKSRNFKGMKRTLMRQNIHIAVNLNRHCFIAAERIVWP